MDSGAMSNSSPACWRTKSSAAPKNSSTCGCAGERSTPPRPWKALIFTSTPTLNRQQILALASCEFVRQKRNLLICGSTGVGKSHLAQALGQEAARQGLDGLFLNTQKMLQHLHGGRADGSWERRLSLYLRLDLLILDEFGLKPLQPPGPKDLYDVINERYEHGSILLTSNRAPTEWLDLFLDPLLASAGLDRLLDRAEVIVIRGPSYRSQGRNTLLEEAQIQTTEPCILRVKKTAH